MASIFRGDDATRTLKVWDLATRGFHWVFAALVFVALLSGEEDERIGLHTRVGLGIIGLLVFRLVWGVVGPWPVRFTSFVRGPREIMVYLGAMLRGRPPPHLSHNPVGAVMVVTLLAVLTMTAASGVVVYLGPEWEGPLSSVLGISMAKQIAELHEGLAELVPWLIVAHVGGVIVSSWLERQNLIAGMVDGRKRAPEVAATFAASPVRSTLGFVAAVGVGAAVVLTLLGLFPVRVAQAAETPSRLLQSYAAEARAENASYAGPSADRGRSLYFTEQTTSAARTSCATCHSKDPRQQGRSPAGKVIAPLAPPANAERFTERKHADKWFERNCKQVLGRACSSAEKADFVAWW